MKIRDSLKGNKFSLSYEFFPPKTEKGEINLKRHIEELKKTNPDFVSVTYGAGGSSREKTVGLALQAHEEASLNVLAHLTLVGHRKHEIKALLERYTAHGIDNILALRGDVPKDGTVRFEDGDFNHAVELVRYIHELFPGQFSVGGAAFPEKHPESPNMDWEMKYFKEKAEAGLDFADTQFFFKNEYYYEYMNLIEKNQIRIPVIPGIMPVTNFKQIRRMAEMSRAEFPSELVEKLEKYSDFPEETMKIGVEYAIRQCEDLIGNGIPGIHFYTLNKSKATLQIVEALQSMIN